MWPNRDLIDLLGIEHPILQAPMGGESTPEMAVAVCNAGGLGGLGCSFLSPEALRDKAEAIRAGTNHPFNLNFFAHDEPALDPAAAEPMRARLAPYYAELVLGEVPEATIPYAGFDEVILETVLELPTAAPTEVIVGRSLQAPDFAMRSDVRYATGERPQSFATAVESPDFLGTGKEE